MKRQSHYLLFLLAAILIGCSSDQSDSSTLKNNTMERRIINPWTWQDSYGFVQSNEVSNVKRTLYTAGIVSVDKDGNLLHPQDMDQQINQILDNLEILLEQSNFKLSDVVKFTYYTTHINDFARSTILLERLKKANCKPATTLIGVAALFHPDCVIEIEAIVVD